MEKPAAAKDVAQLRAELEDSFGLELPPDWSERIEKFHALLVDANATHNLTRLTSRADFLYKHVADSLLVAQAWPALRERPLRVADVGCGGGVPGLVLALSFPPLAVSEIDSSRKKIQCVNGFIDALGLTGCRALAGRARELARRDEFRGSFDVIVARAVGETGDVIRECYQMLTPDGAIVFYKTPAQIDAERPIAEREARKRGLAVEVSELLQLPHGHGERQFLSCRAGCRSAT